MIGTGIGGATLGYALAKAGKSVLFCEKGLAGSGKDESLRGDYAETFVATDETASVECKNTMKRAGRFVDEIDDHTRAKPHTFIPFIGSGAGGSSGLYGMALERFFPADFTPRQHHPGAVDSTLPDAWPIGYAELAPYYRMAEEVYRVRGGCASTELADTASENQAPPLSPAARELTDFMAGKGLHPYRLPLACEFVTGCAGCQGYLCAKECKNDSARVCLAPALSRYQAQLIDDCNVVRVVADERNANEVVCISRGREYILRAETIVIAAGALATPVLLLNSTDSHWPDGLANRSGLVGRNLMRHCVDLYAVFSKARPFPHGNLKELAINDFYLTDSEKFGSVQSFGRMPPAALLVQSLQQELRDARGRLAAALFNPIKPLARSVLHRLFSRTLVLAAVMEDLPYADNRVSVLKTNGKESKIVIRYQLHRHEKARVERFRAHVRNALEPYRFLLLKQAENNERLAHVCGTCRFGDDPQTSVLDRNNRAHGLSNLYVVDGSFFPSSGGTNPALTIAANALRVADHIIAMGKESPADVRS